jgi:hypothetical protein
VASLGLLGAGIGCIVVGANQGKEHKQKKSGSNGMVMFIVGVVMTCAGLLCLVLAINAIVTLRKRS